MVQTRHLWQPVAVQDGPAHGFLLVDVGEVLQSNHVDVLVSPAPLLVLHESAEEKTGHGEETPSSEGAVGYPKAWR